MARDPAPHHRYRPRPALPSILSLSLSFPFEFLEKGNKEESGNSLELEFFRFLAQTERERLLVLIVEEDRR